LVPWWARAEMYFDVYFVDEVQDFGGHDSNFLFAISAAKVNRGFAGDFHHHTFDTSRDGNLTVNLHENCYAYKKKFERARMKVDTDSRKRIRRCNKNVCDFITEKIGIAIPALYERTSVVHFEDDPAADAALYVRLFRRRSARYPRPLSQCSTCLLSTFLW
jgi:DNA helicase-2/ATP-dependent DNA helicase PcrA